MAVCWFCGVDEHCAAIKLLKCAKCKVPSYCSKLCQKDDWKHHKTCCRPLPTGPIIPSLPVKEDEKPIVAAFNQLSRSPILFHANRNNHWHFAARPISEKGCCLFATHPATNRTYIEGPFYLSANEPLDKWAACIVPHLLSLFVISTYSSDSHDSHGTQCGGLKRAPWTWSTTNSELAVACEKRLREVGVKEDLCHVGWSKTGEEALEKQATYWATSLAEANKNPLSRTRTWEGMRLSNMLSNTDATGDDQHSDPFPMAFEDGYDTKYNMKKPTSQEAGPTDTIPSVDDDID
jgi:MYND finger